MTAVQDVQHVLKIAMINGIDEIHTNNLPEEEKSNVNRTVVLLTDNGLGPDEYGNNDFYGINRGVELQIWYARDLTIDPEQIEIAILKAMHQAKWLVDVKRRRIVDPDTFQLANTIYFSQIRTIGG